MRSIFCSAETSDPETWFVCALGIAVVFVGLLSLICIVALMNKIIGNRGGKPAPTAAAPTEPAPLPAAEPIENRQELIAAICAAVAEENGVDISALRVISFKKI